MENKMNSLNCKLIQTKDVVKCALTLTKKEYEIFTFLVKNREEWFTTENLRDKLQCNLSTVQRAMKKLYESNMVDRMQNNLDTGGYIYIYKIVHRGRIFEILDKHIDNWAREAKRKLESEL